MLITCFADLLCQAVPFLEAIFLQVYLCAAAGKSDCILLLLNYPGAIAGCAVFFLIIYHLRKRSRAGIYELCQKIISVIGELFVFGIALLVLFSIPLLTGSFARSKGRRFWLWFFMAMVLPLIATFIISALPDLSEDNVPGENKQLN